MLLFYTFFPFISFIYTCICGIFLGKDRTAILIVAHVYLLNIILGFIAFIKVCVLGTISYITLGT